MLELVARAVLRILGIVTALVGVILTLHACIAWMAVSTTLSGGPAGMQIKATSMLGEVGIYAIIAQAVTILLGVALFYMSPALARRVVA